VRDGRALGNGLGVLALHPLPDPLVRMEVPCLQEESPEDGALIGVRIYNHRYLLTRVIGLGIGHNFVGIRVGRLTSGLAMIGLIGPLFHTRIRGRSIRKGYGTAHQEDQLQGYPVE